MASEYTPLVDDTHGAGEFARILNSFTWAGEKESPDAPAKTGSITSSAMNLAACALGASMLSLPYAMMVSGPLVSLFMLVLFAVMSYFAAQSVVNAGLRCKKSSYAEIVRYYFGNVQGIVCDTLLSVALAVAAISYIVGLRDLMPNLIGAFENVPPAARVIGVLLVLYPVTLISNLAVFGPASMFAVAGCYIQAGALILQYLTDDSEAAVEVADKWVKVDFAGLLYSLPMVCFVYAFHYVLTDTLSEVHNPTPIRMSQVSLSTIGILIGCYLPVAISGYLSTTGKCANSNLLNCLPNGSPIVSIANWSIGLLLFITYSLFIIPLRRKLEEVVFGEQSTMMFAPKRLIVAAGLMAVIGTISIALENLGLANTLAGGCIALVMFYFPGALMWKMEMDIPVFERNRTQLIFGATFMTTGLLICVMGFFGNILFKEENMGEIPAIMKAAADALAAAAPAPIAAPVQ